MRSELLTPKFTADGEQTIEGIYPLGALRGRSAGGVVYETTFSEEEGASSSGIKPAAIKIARGDLEESGEILERWRHAMTLSHPNLLRVYAAGASVVNDAPIIYVVMERAEESLAGVLARRRLSEEETLETIGPALAALEYLHRNGYAHGRIKPSNVMAVGDSVKLSSDSVAPGNDEQRAEDIRAAGRLIQESLASGLDGSPVLAEIAVHALEPDPARRWTIRQIEARLRTPDIAVAKAADPGVPEPPHAREAPRRGVPGWIFAGLAAVVLIVAGLAIMRSKEPAPPREPAVAAEVPATVHAPAPAATPVRPPAPAPAQQGRRASGWSVIVAAYGTRAPAEKRLRSLESKWARFQWSLLEQRAEKTYYLVVIGHDLGEDAAEALRKRAIQAGLPRDTYIKRVS
ncbi:MAG TPA: protein kinase [Bryobacteraceae bacterium]|nr:protein kinase [Bryobacteraceae bacterium]